MTMILDVYKRQDKDTVYGVYFSHAGETPGLGAEITTVKFQDQFLGKHVLENGIVALGLSLIHIYRPMGVLLPVVAGIRLCITQTTLFVITSRR